MRLDMVHLYNDTCGVAVTPNSIKPGVHHVALEIDEGLVLPTEMLQQPEITELKLCRHPLHPEKGMSATFLLACKSEQIARHTLRIFAPLELALGKVEYWYYWGENEDHEWEVVVKYPPKWPHRISVRFTGKKPSQEQADLILRALQQAKFRLRWHPVEYSTQDYDSRFNLSLAGSYTHTMMGTCEAIARAVHGVTT